MNYLFRVTLAFAMSAVILLTGTHAFSQNKVFDWRDEERDKRDVWREEYDHHPTIELHYGLPAFGLADFNRDFQETGAAEIRVGHVGFRKMDGPIIHSFGNYFKFSSFSRDLAGGGENAASNDVNVYLLRFALENKDGYGYSFGKAALIPYTSVGYNITRIDPSDYTSAYPEDVADPLLTFGDKFRFGTSAESGLSLRLTDMIAVNAGYVRSLIFPRWMFWKYSVSSLIEMGGLGMIGEFVDAIAESSPVAGPIVNFVLKSGWSYTLYELRQDDMNWPFATAEPFSVDSFKAGVSFIF
ncbi:MAG: hypothetical protein GF372_02285 [Candidatus Marinimicrobia bacterium]|nr:hypothetical protein [Candidatus Neomarinimicrobiota bacterium]